MDPLQDERVPARLPPERRARIEQRTAELEAQDAPAPGDDMIRLLAALLPLPATPPPPTRT